MFPLLGLVTSATFLVAILFIEPLAWGIGVTSLAGGMVYYTGRRIVVSIRRRL
jgi:hypothetical protein